MFCPQCGSNQSDELKFCKSCGANLYAVRQVVATRGTGDKFDWSKTWVAEMFLSKAEADRLRGITPEVKRYNEIKDGVITSCAGLGVAIFLYVLMQGIILSGNVTPGAAEILSRVWIAGVIPLLVGIALIINGLFVSKRLVEIAKQEEMGRSWGLERGSELDALPAAETAEFIPASFSVTEETTKHLAHEVRNKKRWRES